jgi:hypothetical protein
MMDTRAIGDAFEETVLKAIPGAKKTSNSGAIFGNGDIQSDDFTIECKVKNQRNISISFNEYKKARQQSIKQGKDLIFCQRTNLGDFAILSLETLEELLKYYD